jgi:hypothetical protein
MEWAHHRHQHQSQRQRRWRARGEGEWHMETGWFVLRSTMDGSSFSGLLTRVDVNSDVPAIDLA